MPATNRKFWNNVGDEIKLTKESMQPLLKEWLLPGIQGEFQPQQSGTAIDTDIDCRR
jgi:nuclear pore complex protein Nup107